MLFTLIFFASSNISIFYQYGTTVNLFQGIFWMYILLHLNAWIEFFFLIIFGLSFYKSLDTYCNSY